MLVKELIIKNYCGVNLQVKLNLSASNIEKSEIQKDSNLKFEGKLLIVKIIVFIGKNVFGKTYILQSITTLIDSCFHPSFLLFKKQIQKVFHWLKKDYKQIKRKTC